MKPVKQAVVALNDGTGRFVEPDASLIALAALWGYSRLLAGDETARRFARRAYRFMAEDSIYLAPEARGRGIGRVLLDRLVAQCDAQGFRQVVAVIGDGSSNHASVRLHAAAGFRHSGVLEGSGYKHGRWLDTTFMQITLNGGTSTAPDREPLRI